MSVSTFNGVETALGESPSMRSAGVVTTRTGAFLSFCFNHLGRSKAPAQNATPPPPLLLSISLFLYF
jgi:hypothetical protein